MSRRYWLWAFFCSALFLAGCGGGGKSNITIGRGVAGQVYIWEGDFRSLPLGNIPSSFSRPNLSGVRGLVYSGRRRLELHPYTEALPHIDVNGFVEDVTTEPVASTISDGQGFFEVDVPPGRYRVLVREEDRLWFGRPDLGLPFIPIEVRENSVATVRIDVTWGAIFQ